MKKIINILIISASLLMGFGINLQPLHASDLTVQTPPINPVESEDVGGKIILPGRTGSDQGQYIQSTFLPNVTKIIIEAAGGLSLLFVIVGGIQILTAYNNEERATGARKTLTWALVGLIISMLSYAIVQAIISINLYLPKK